MPPLLRSLLEHPHTRGLAIDAPETSARRGALIRGKGLLRRVYREWYERLAATIPPPPGAVLELGSGGGFFRDVFPDAITSDIFEIPAARGLRGEPLPGVDRVIDAHALPFGAGELRAIVMTNVLHHIPRVREFLRSAASCVRAGGVISMIEPWSTRWSRLVYRRLHHEPFDTGSRAWEFPTTGPLSGANGALPWILVERDRASFEREFPEWRIEAIRPMMPISFVVAGGVSLRSFAPGWLYGPLRALERPFARCAMFAHILLRRVEVPS